MTLKNSSKSTQLCYGLFIISASTTTNALELTANTTAEVTNNAFKTQKNKVTERQDTVEITTLHTQESSRSKLDIDYSISYTNYQKKSQESLLQINGNSVGYIDISSNINAWLSHSAKEVLDSPGQPQLSSNIDNRHITGTGINALLNKGNHNTFTLSPNITDVHYRDNSDLDSTRKGAQLNWNRNATPTTEVGIAGLHQNIDYAQGEDGKYDKANLNVARKLRQLSYRIEIGYNQINTSFGQKLNSPFMSFLAEYSNGIHSFTTKYNNSVSDTSLGNQNDPLSSNIDGNRNSLDLFELQQFFISHKYNRACRGCIITTTYNWAKENYQRQPIDDTREQEISLTLNYQISPLDALSLLTKLESTDFFNRTGKDFQQTNLAMTYNKAIGRSTVVKFATEYEFRDSNKSSDSYSEWTSNIALSFNL